MPWTGSRVKLCKDGAVHHAFRREWWCTGIEGSEGEHAATSTAAPRRSLAEESVVDSRWGLRLALGLRWFNVANRRVDDSIETLDNSGVLGKPQFVVLTTFTCSV